MVLVRACFLAWVGLVPVVWCLPLDGLRPSSLQPLALPHDLHSSPQDLPQDDLHPQQHPLQELQEQHEPVVSRSEKRASAPLAGFRNYDDSERDILHELGGGVPPVVYQLEEVLSNEAGAPEGIRGIEGTRDYLEIPDEEVVEDGELMGPHYYLLSQYLKQGMEDKSPLSTMNSLRRIRNNNPNSSSITSTSSIGSSPNGSTSSSGALVNKRTWPSGVSRRRNSGLSLSIDASMKVLREALYMEMVRKKQRQQLQRARHNQALLTTIGKRDTRRQLMQDNRPPMDQHPPRK